MQLLNEVEEDPEGEDVGIAGANAGWHSWCRMCMFLLLMR